MYVFIALLVHGVAYASAADVIAAPQVRPHAWLLLYVLGAASLAMAELRRAPPVKPGTWAQLLVYSCLFALFFAGANFALDALGNSVKPRAELPAFVGGLPLHLALCPGVAAVALGGLVAAILRSRYP